MSISFVQQHKDLYRADFLVTHNDRTIAKLDMHGSMLSREGEWTGFIMGRQVHLTPGANAPGFKPYEIRVDGRLVGTVAQIDVKTGLFSQHQFHEMHLDGKTYQLYSVGLGRAGGASCLYCADTQLAEIDSDCVVRNELYEYEIFAVDEQSAFVSILMCCYMYMRGCYRPGEKPVQSTATYVTVTTNKALKAKYDPRFKATRKTI